MVFRTQYGHFKYTIIPFDFINAPVTFQAYIHKVFTGLLDIIYIADLNDILIFSQTKKKYRKYLRLVLKRFRNTKLFAKLSKCFFFRSKIRFLGFIVRAHGIYINPNRIKVILK